MRGSAHRYAAPSRGSLTRGTAAEEDGVEQRTDETRRPGAAAEDTGPPSAEERSGSAPDSSDDATETSGPKPSFTPAAPSASASPSGTDTARDLGRGLSTSGNGFGSAPASTGSTGSTGGYRSPASDRSRGGSRNDTGYPADSAYPGPSLDDGYGPPGT